MREYGPKVYKYVPMFSSLQNLLTPSERGSFRNRGVCVSYQGLISHYDPPMIVLIVNQSCNNIYKPEIVVYVRCVYTRISSS